MEEARRIGYVDVTTRDAHQSLWATRMTTAMILPFASRLDQIGFDALNLVGGAVFDVCVRYLHEDPWERMRAVVAQLRDTPVDVMTRGQSLYTFEFFPDDVVELNMVCLARTGIRRVTVYDALNDARNLELSIKTAQRQGLYVCAGIVFSVSPVHTDEYFASVARELVALAPDAVFLKDPSGLLTPERVRTLIPVLRRALGDLPFELHSHSLSGLAEISYLEAVPLGVDVLHTAISPLASGASLPPTEYCVKHLGRLGYSSDLDGGGLDAMADYFRGVATRHGFPLAVPHRFDPDLYRHQVPGGMISNLRSQLADMGMADREEEILAEAERVRVDFGYPILVSPFAQYVVTQAVLNVAQGDPYRTIPIEMRRYALGLYGRPAGEIAPDLLERIVAESRDHSEPYTDRPGALMAPALERVRAERGPFTSDDDLLLAVFYSQAQLASLYAARARGLAARVDHAPLTPLKLLLAELSARDDLREVDIARPGAQLKMRWGSH
jgi:oxaloacetate decarboxylase (Na+ extruding) subunit alpha